ncbi:hypothetical protein [[Ruminococcus] torques]|nr:hypothetical protein [[Ruminococcus] torques]
MITKFERKVIAGLTAFLMCLSMVLAVPVSVNAEAEQTQDEAVSGAKQEETVSDVQMQDETVNDAQQDVTTGEEVEEGAAGDIQKLPGMSAESTDAMPEYNVTRRCDRKYYSQERRHGRIRFDYAAGRSDICSLSVEC